MNGAETGITTTAEVMEFSRDIGRKWGDLHEIFVWEDGSNLMKYTLLLPSHPPRVRCDPENVDAFEHSWGLKPIGKHRSKTDDAIAAYNGL